MPGQLHERGIFGACFQIFEWFDLMYLIFSVAEKVVQFFVLQDHRGIFENYADAKSSKITENRFMTALKDLNLASEQDSLDLPQLFREADIDEDGTLDMNEFSRFLNRPSKLEQWSNTLPLAKLLSFCLLAADESASAAPDPLRIICGLNQQALDTVVDGFSTGLKRLLHEGVKQLKVCYSALDKKAVEDLVGSGTNVKFQAITMCAGKVEDFHKGISDRVGDAVHMRTKIGGTNSDDFDDRGAAPRPIQGDGAGALRDVRARRAVSDDQLRRDDHPSQGVRDNHGQEGLP